DGVPLDRVAPRHVEVDVVPPAGDRGGLVVVAGAAHVRADQPQAGEVVGDGVQVEGTHAHRRDVAGLHAPSFLHALVGLGGLRVAARVGDRVVDPAADDAQVQEDRHAEFLGGLVDGKVLVVVVVAARRDDL